MLPRWLPVGCHRDGGYGRSGKRSRGDADLNRVGTAALGCPAERSSAAPNPRARIQLLSSLANCPLCLGGLLPHMHGDIGQIALIRVDGRYVVGLPNPVHRTQCLPELSISWLVMCTSVS